MKPKEHIETADLPPLWLRMGLRVFGVPQQNDGASCGSPEADTLAACLGIKPAALISTNAKASPSIRRLFYRLATGSLLRRGTAVAIPVADFDHPTIAAGSLVISRTMENALIVASLFEQARAGLPLADFHAALGRALGYDATAVARFLHRPRIAA